MKLKRLSLLIFAIWLFAMVLGRVFNPDPNAIDLTAVLGGPDRWHWFGTDELGRDILARVLAGAEISIMVAIGVTAVSMSLGVLIGMLAGYYGGWVDALLMQITDVFMAFPGILLAIAFAAVLGPGIGNLLLALSLTGWVSYARLARGQSLTLRSRQHVIAALSLGAGSMRVMLRHLLPLMISLRLPALAYSITPYSSVMV